MRPRAPPWLRPSTSDSTQPRDGNIHSRRDTGASRRCPTACDLRLRPLVSGAGSRSQDTLAARGRPPRRARSWYEPQPATASHDDGPADRPQHIATLMAGTRRRIPPEGGPTPGTVPLAHKGLESMRGVVTGRGSTGLRSSTAPGHRGWTCPSTSVLGRAPTTGYGGGPPTAPGRKVFTALLAQADAESDLNWVVTVDSPSSGPTSTSPEPVKSGPGRRAGPTCPRTIPRWTDHQDPPGRGQSLPATGLRPHTRPGRGRTRLHRGRGPSAGAPANRPASHHPGTLSWPTGSIRPARSGPISAGVGSGP